MCGDGGGTKQEFAQSERFGNIARSLWTGYTKRFAPVQQQLSQTLQTDGFDANRQAELAGETVNKAFDTQRQGMALDLSRRGLALTPDQAAASGRQFGLARSSALVANQNAARQGVLDADTALVGGGGLSSSGRNIQLGG